MTTRKYGWSGTIHHNIGLDVEVDPNGEIVSVWFRCQLLPFNVTQVDFDRSHDMKYAYSENCSGNIPKILGLELEDED